MPKLKQTAIQKARERMRRNLRVIQKAENMTSEDMGKIIGRSHATWDNRLRNPDNLTYAEMQILCTKFNIDMAILCAGELYQTKGN